MNVSHPAIRVLRGFLRLLSSYGLASLLLLLLMVLTFAGTLEQRHASIYDVQRRYFDSLLVPIRVAGIPLVLPGAFLLLSLLFVNLLVGGVLRLQRTWSRAGILIAHCGILLLLAGGFVETFAANKGFLDLRAQEPYLDGNGNGRWDPGEPHRELIEDGRWTPGESKNHYASYHEWDLVLIEPQAAGGATEWTIPFEDLLDLEGGGRARYSHPDLPVLVEVQGFARNAQPTSVGKDAPFGVDGLALRALPPDPEKAEFNLPGLTAVLKSPKMETTLAQVLLWAGQKYAAPVAILGRTFWLDLRRRHWPLPFHLRLNEFIHRRHPGTDLPSEYSSTVTRIEGGLTEDLLITMNEPLRHAGYILYQSSFQDPQPGRPLAVSVFAVSQNPADRIPLIACLVIAAGLLTHFVRKLFRWVRSEQEAAR